MIKIKPDREGLLTQWDLNRRIQITGLEDISNTEIHFSKTDDTKGAYVVLPVIENGIAFADIPNILLTVSGRIDVFVYRDDHTCVRGVFVVAPREKPDDYIYEETEVLKYEDFVERLDGLETQKEDKANRVTTVDDNSDDEHYPTAKAVYKAIPKSLKNPYSLTFTGAVTGSYDGSKPMTFNIPVGGSGTDISLGVTGAAVGDIIKVKAVDASGKPTAWEAVTAKLANPNALTFTGAVTGSYDGSAPLSVDIPSGGSETMDLSWKHIRDVELTPDAIEAIVSTTDAGNAFSYDEIMFEFIPNLRGYFYVRASQSVNFSNNVKVWITNSKYTQMHIGLINKKLAITSVYRTDGPVGFSNEYGGTGDIDKISMIVFGASSTVGAAFTVKIWGR